MVSGVGQQGRESSVTQKPEGHDARMQAVYEHLYQDRYQFKANEIANAEKLIVKNLGEMGLTQEFLKDRTVMDMGTGRQAVAFSRLGAKAVYHFDVSPVPVDALGRLAHDDPQFANIRSRLADVCLPIRLDASDGLDLVYLVGILQHLHDPRQAMVNILPVVNREGYVYFRNYRSGTLNMLVVDFLRRLVSRKAGDAFAAHFARRYPAFRLHQDNTHQSILARFYTSLYDHLFVPVLRLYDPRLIDGFFQGAGFVPIVDHACTAYDHNLDMVLGGIGISLYYQLRPGRVSRTMPPFPQCIDQLSGLNYNEPYIRRTVGLMMTVLDRAARLSLVEIFDLAIDAYWAAFGHALYAFYNSTNEVPTREIASTDEAAHRQLNDLLGPLASA